LVGLPLDGFSLQDLLLACRYFQIILEVIAEIQIIPLKVISITRLFLLAFGFCLLKFIKKPLFILGEINMPFQSFAQTMAHDPQVEKGRSLRDSL